MGRRWRNREVSEKPVAMIEQELAERPMKLIQAAAEWRHTNELAARQAESDEDFDE